MTLQEKFEAYDRANPQVYEAFRKYAFQLREAGRKRSGAALIFERIRWDTMIRGSKEDGLPALKMNNNYRAFYARKLALESPIYFETFFETREQKSLAVA